MEAIFTRYLYFKEEVTDNLIWAILDKAADEALFWGYELYFSGFQYEVYEVLNVMHETLFEEKNPNIGIYLNSLIKEWDDNHEKHYILGTIINVFLKCKISLTSILRSKDKINISISNSNISDMMFPERLYEDEVKKYYTIIASVDTKILDKVCKYKIRKLTCNDLGLIGFDSKEKHKENWLYYANATPIWNERILMFNGKSDKLTRSIVFGDDASEECFHNMYNYDVDEGSTYLKNKIWSSESSVDISLSEFYKKYGDDCIYRTVRICKNKC